MEIDVEARHNNRIKNYGIIIVLSRLRLYHVDCINNSTRHRRRIVLPPPFTQFKPSTFQQLQSNIRRQEFESAGLREIREEITFSHQFGKA